jgi:hypothetical protein
MAAGSFAEFSVEQFLNEFALLCAGRGTRLFCAAVAVTDRSAVSARR